MEPNRKDVSTRSTSNRNAEGPPAVQRHRARRGLFFLFGALTLLLAACAGESNSDTDVSTFNPVAGSWEAQSLSVEGDMEIDLEGDPLMLPTLTIQGNRITGFTGCNTFDGTVDYDISGDRFSAAIDSVTEKACDSMTEEFFLQALGGATTFLSEPGQLTLSDGAEFPTTIALRSVVQS